MDKENKTSDNRQNATSDDNPKPVDIEIPKLETKPTKRKKRKTDEHEELEKNLSVFLKTIFDLLALKDTVWVVEKTEIEAISKPGARILEKMGAEKETNENADYILLFLGIVGIIVPRLMVIRARGQVNHEQAKSETKVGHSSTENNGATPGRNEGNVKVLLPGLA